MTQEYHPEMKTRDILFYFSVILLLVLAIVAFLSFATTQVYVDSDGVVHEPIHLVPTVYLLILLAVTVVIICLWRNQRRR